MLSDREAHDLLDAARAIAARAHVPYSHFPVGAALLTEDGEVVAAVNVENASYGLTICAERSAVVAAVAQGKKRFRAIAVHSPRAAPCVPCGACRQVLMEFAPDIDVVLEDRDGNPTQAPLSEFLPRAFTEADLRE